jgi:hypothetical protein
MKKLLLLSTAFAAITSLSAVAQTSNRPGVTIPTLEVNLFAKDIDGSIYLADGVLLNFNNIYSAGVDNFDVRKINNVADNLAVKCGNFNLIVERRPDLVLNDSIKLSLTHTRVAPYRFDIDPSVLTNYTGTLEPFLVDKFTQTQKAISLANITSYAFDITNDAASKAADRFVVVLKAAATTSFTTISAIRNVDKSITIKWGAALERNVNTYTIEQSNDGINFTAISTQAPASNAGANTDYTKLDAAASRANNWYRVKITNTSGTTTYSAVAMVGAVADVIGNRNSKMSIYPNPVEGGNINLHLDNQLKGLYKVQISNQVGQVVRTENIQVQSNNELRIIHVGAPVTGRYQAVIIDANGNKTVVPFVIK